MEARTETEVFNESDIKKAISRLNSGKSADESGIQTEHLKHGRLSPFAQHRVVYCKK